MSMRRHPGTTKRAAWAILTGLGLVLTLAMAAALTSTVLGAGIADQPAQASAGAALHRPSPDTSPLRGEMETAPRAQLSNEDCLACHSQPEMLTSFENGDPLYLTIDGSAFDTSVHGQHDLACTDCHTDIDEFPHPDKGAGSAREFSAKTSATCEKCHAEQFQQFQEGVHAAAHAAGNPEAAVCSDCHNPHYQIPVTDPQTGETTQEWRQEIPLVCARCHSTVFEQYKNTVHGKALLNENNPDVPTCVDCHGLNGVHNLPDPTTAEFRLKSPVEMCGRCHSDPAIMDKYGISTNVLNSYVSDFHGTTVELFKSESPDQKPNTPVCFDCHGVHEITAVDDPHAGLQMKENLLTTCRQCHPGASANFPSAWMSHYEPSPDHFPLVYYVNLFYLIVIPVTIVGMVIFVISDIARRIIDRRKKGTPHG
jgi:hypothetical protein